MSEPPRLRPPSQRPARTRVRTRGMAQQRGRTMHIAGIVLGAIVLLVGALVVLALRRADQTLRTIEQNDPRRGPSATANAARSPVQAGKQGS